MRKVQNSLVVSLLVCALGLVIYGCVASGTNNGGSTTQPTTQPVVVNNTLAELQKIDAEVQAISAVGTTAGIPYAPIALAITTLIGGVLTVIQTMGKSTAQTQLTGSNQAAQALATTVSASATPNVAQNAIAHAQALAPHLVLPKVVLPTMGQH